MLYIYDDDRFKSKKYDICYEHFLKERFLSMSEKKNMPEHDYYKDVMPEINDIIRRTPGETLAKIVLLATAVIGIALYLIYG